MSNKIFVLVVALVIVVLVFRMLRSRALREKYAALWIVVGVGTLLLAVFPGLLAGATSLLGFAVPSNLVFVIATLLLLAVSLQLSLELSNLEDETRVLAEESAIHRLTISQLHRRVDALERSEDRRPEVPAERPISAGEEMLQERRDRREPPRAQRGR